MKSFITELRLDKMLSQMKRGDYLLIQFGHNDEKASWPQTYVEAGTTYKAYLKAFIAEARRRGATPVLLSGRCSGGNSTPMGKIRNSHGELSRRRREVAKEEKVAFIDLSAVSIAFYEALGPGEIAARFQRRAGRATHAP